MEGLEEKLEARTPTTEVNVDARKAGELISEWYRQAFAPIVHDEKGLLDTQRVIGSSPVSPTNPS
jgi:hypothetical protein